MKPVIRWAGCIFVFSCMITVSFAQHSSGQIGLGVYGSGIKLIGGEADNCVIDYSGGISLKYSFSALLTGEITTGLGWVRPRDPDSHFKVRAQAPYRTYIYSWSANLRFNMLPEKRISPYASIGAGLTYWDLRDISGEDKWFPFPASGTSLTDLQTNFTLLGTIGTTLFLSENVGIDFGIRYSHMLDQKLDNIGTSYITNGIGDKNNGMIEVRLGLGFFFGGSRDSDGDGIPNREDNCPDEPEDLDGFEDEDGCPDLDNDNDGIPDHTDGAPNLPEDIDGFQDGDGIPDLDNDEDGITDERDKCPNEPEDFDGFEDQDGCPDLDNDNDGIPDPTDKCPNKPETFNDYQDDDGCPDEKPKPGIVEIGEGLVLPDVTFATGKAELTENAKTVLNTVFEILQDNPGMRVEIRGYTDNTGNPAINLNLSQRRSETVKDYLVKKGIAFDRLRAIGYGEANPIASNETKEGREKNRRIEFVRIEE